MAVSLARIDLAGARVLLIGFSLSGCWLAGVGLDHSVVDGPLLDPALGGCAGFVAVG